MPYGRKGSKVGWEVVRYKKMGGMGWEGGHRGGKKVKGRSEDIQKWEGWEGRYTTREERN